jgi:hypothetical protein
MPRCIRTLLPTLMIIVNFIGSVSAVEITLVINEFMASNNSSVQDPQGRYDDWIEIYNYGTEPSGGFQLIILPQPQSLQVAIC